jgi:bacterioferritin-associated ferredoxin
VIVCLCYGTGEPRIRAAVKAGAATLHEVVERCGAGGDCGACHVMILELIEQTLERPYSEGQPSGSGGGPRERRPASSDRSQ